MLDTTYLHIGLDKTGSTAIQVACDQNRGPLSGLGVLYPSGGVDGGMHAQFASCFYDDPRAYYFNRAHGRARKTIEELQQEDAAYLEDIKRQIQCSSTKTLVLSYEGFVSLGEQELRKMRAFLDTISKVTKIIVYLRDPMSYAASAVSQRAKSGKPLWSEVPVRDWRGMCETFGSVFGSENLIARKFSRDSLQNGDVRQDFFNLIGLASQATDGLVLSDDQDNTSLSMEAILIGDSLRKIGAAKDLSEGEFFATYARILEGVKGSKFQLSAEEVEEVRNASKAQLEYVHQAFGITFEDGKTKTARQKVSLADNFVQSIAEFIHDMAKKNAPSAGVGDISKLAAGEAVPSRPNFSAPHFVLHPNNPNKNASLERGQVITINIDFLVTRNISELQITLHIQDGNGRLAFGVNNELLGQTYNNVVAGSYRASFHVITDLPCGKYAIGFSAAEKESNKRTEVAWYGAICELDVFDSMAINAAGYASLPVEMTFSPTREAKQGHVISQAKGTVSSGDFPAFSAGEVKTIGVRLHNQGETPWVGDVFRPVKLSYHWLNRDNETVVFEGTRTSLPAGGVRPGQSLLTEMTVEAPNEAGAYTLELTLVQERVGWLEARGLEPARLDVAVKALSPEMTGTAP